VSQPHGIESRVPYPGPSPPPPSAAQPSHLTAPEPSTLYDTQLRVQDFFAYIHNHFPKIIQFTPDYFGGGRVRYVSPVFVGIWFQLLPTWFEERGLNAQGWQIRLPLSVLLEGIEEHLRRFGSHGSPVENGEDPKNWGFTTYWFLGGMDGDGIVWPNAFGGLVVKWSRPGSIRDLRSWLSPYS
jgi:hypothetical protein